MLVHLYCDKEINLISTNVSHKTIYTMKKKLTFIVKDLSSALTLIYALTNEQLLELVLEVSFNSRNYKIEFFKNSVDICNSDNDVIYVSVTDILIRQQFIDCLKKVFM